MELGNDGLVVGGVDVAWVKSDGSIGMENVTDPVLWVKGQFLELKRLREESDFGLWRTIFFESKFIFADLSYKGSEYMVRYRHPKYVTIQGFFHIPREESFPSVDDASETVVLRATSVDLFAGQDNMLILSKEN